MLHHHKFHLNKALKYLKAKYWLLKEKLFLKHVDEVIIASSTIVNSDFKNHNIIQEKLLALEKRFEELSESMPDAIVEIQDLAGDGNHYSATVTSSLFNGKSKIEQHKMVYNSLKGRMGNELHALAIKTKEQ